MKKLDKEFLLLLNKELDLDNSIFKLLSTVSTPVDDWFGRILAIKNEYMKLSSEYSELYDNVRHSLKSECYEYLQTLIEKRNYDLLDKIKDTLNLIVSLVESDCPKPQS